MSRNTISIAARPDEVFDVLENAYAYPRWVLGARRIRHVDPSWPAVGSKFHHAIGTAAGELHDSSKVVENVRPLRMRLEVRFRPTGVADVDIAVTSVGSGSEVTLEEHSACGPISVLPTFLVDPLLSLRNAISLRRLRREVEQTKTAPVAP